MSKPATSKTIAVVGNGLIGHGVAQVFAMAGHNVRLIGRSESSLVRARERIRDSLAQFAAHSLIKEAEIPAIMGRVAAGTALDAASAAELVCEAVSYDLGLIGEIVGKLDALCGAAVPLCSCSGAPPSKYVGQARRHPERVVATHFWYPSQLIPLVEVCPGSLAAPAITDIVMGVLRAAGKEPVLIEREITGLIGNRLQFAMLREAWALWADGVASAEAIDTVVRTSFGRRLGITGPLESADLAGLDTMYAYAETLLPDLDTSAQPAAAIAKLVNEGARGLPSGRGVYDWSKRDGAGLLRARMDELMRWLAADALTHARAASRNLS
jgi:3-hydroxybutyryl-CoA dehydrogenase